MNVVADNTCCDIMEVNGSIHKTLKGIIKAEMLQFKLEDALALAENGDE